MRKNKIKKRHMKMSFGEKVFVTVNITLLMLFTLIVLYPVLYVVSGSVSDPDAVATGEMILLPVKASLEGYRLILKYKDLWIGYGNSILYTVVGTMLNLAVTLPCAYALSRKDMHGRKFILTLFVITMYIGGGLIPNYLNVNSMGLVNTRTYMLISGLVSSSNLIVARTYFGSSIPLELQEASFLDGCSNFKVFTKVVLPLSAPIVMVMMMYYGVSRWNDYFTGLIYIKTRDLYPLQVFLKEILTESQIEATTLSQSGYTAEEIALMEAKTDAANRMKFCIIVVSTAPMLAIYPFVQKYFEKGIMIGSLKG